MENAKLLGADEYLGTKEGVLMLEEKVDEGVRAYREAVLQELPGTDLSKVDKRLFPGAFQEE